MSASSLAVDALTSWEQVASYWDANFGKDGNKYYNRLQKPCLVRLLEDKLVKSKTGICRALEFATGNGICARFLASHGVEVLATDGAEQMLEIAKEHVGEGSGLKIKWRRVDVTKREELEVLVRENPEGFDIILINMAIMDIATTDPLAEAIPKMLAGDGVFVASVLHPAFVTSSASRNIELKYNPETGLEEVIHTKIISKYLSIPPTKGIACVGQPRLQWYFHRPMGELFAAFFRHGLLMDAMEELAFSEEDAIYNRVESNSNFPQIPFILYWRMRRAN